MRPLAAFLACSVLLARAAPASGVAPKAHAVLEWQRDEGAATCIDAEALQRAVEARLRREVFSGDADLVVRGQASASEEGYVVRLGLFTRDGRKIGSRELTTRAPHCSALDDSVALVVAIMVDVPEDIAKPVSPPPPPERTNGASRILLPPRTHAPRAPWRASAALFAVAGWGLVPGIAPGIRLRGGIRPPSFWWVEADATYFADSEVQSGAGGATFSRLSAGLWLCPLSWESPRLRAGGCAGQTLSRLEATGFGFDENRSQTRLLYDVGVRGVSWWRFLPPFAVGVGLGADLPLVRDSFVLSRRPGGPEELFRPAFLAFTAEAGLGVELP